MSSEEYLQRLKTPFVPPTHTLAQVRAAVPKHLHHRSTIISLGHVFRDIALAGVFGYAATQIDGFTDSIQARSLQLFGYGTNSVSVEARNNTMVANWDSSRRMHSMMPPIENIAIPTVQAATAILRWALWATYLWFQSLVWAGIWCLGKLYGAITVHDRIYTCRP